MYLALHLINQESVDIAKQSFPPGYNDVLKDTVPDYHGSLVWRRAVANYIHKETGVWHEIPTWVYQIEDTHYFSYAHIQDYVLVVVDDEKVGIDIARIAPRDTSLLQKYAVELQHIWSKDRESFYIMRTCKEALIKFLNLGFDEIDAINLVRTEHFDARHGDLMFDKKVLLVYHGSQYWVQHGKRAELSYALAVAIA
jgi:hypothetical protein